MSERTILVDGFSKSYSMTGWRLGYGIMPEALAEKVSLLLVHSVGCTAEFTQWAGIEALTGPQTHVERRRESYRARRDALVSGLNSIKGIHCQSPAGAFYVFPNVRSFGLSSLEIANRLLDEAGIALLPGTAFGKGGEGFLRLCYAVSEEEIATAIDVMRKWFSQL